MQGYSLGNYDSTSLNDTSREALVLRGSALFPESKLLKMDNLDFSSTNPESLLVESASETCGPGGSIDAAIDWHNPVSKPGIVQRI